MKKKTFMLLVAALFILKAGAQQVEEIQRSLITKRTASWCPNCGGWGWNFFEGLLEDNKDKAILIAAHHDGNYETDSGKDITANFGGGYQPRFFLNENDMGANSSSASTKRAEVKSAVESAFNTAPVANVGFEPVFGNVTLFVDAKVKFFQNAEGDFYLGVYLLEDGVIGYQSGQGDNANHKKVFRYSFTDETFGKSIANGQISAGSEYDLSFDLQIGEVQGYDYEVVGIIWKLENGVYKPFNAWSTKDIGTATSTSDISGLNKFEVLPNITSNYSVINIELEENRPNASLEIIDLNGKRVATINKGNLIKGQQTFPLDKTIVGGNGIYFVRLLDGNQVSTRKIVFQ